MTKTNSKTSFPFFSEHNFTWKMNHLKILNALNNGCKTNHEIYMTTELSYNCIDSHKKEIVKCPKCKQYVLKCSSCFYCFTKLYNCRTLKA